MNFLCYFKNNPGALVTKVITKPVNYMRFETGDNGVVQGVGYSPSNPEIKLTEADAEKLSEYLGLVDPPTKAETTKVKPAKGKSSPGKAVKGKQNTEVDNDGDNTTDSGSDEDHSPNPEQRST